MTNTELLELVGKYAAYAVTTFVAGGAGAYLGSYLRKKGENLATHEDIGKLVEQIKAVTTATKEIEATISNDVWGRQQRWEVQKATLLDSLRELASTEALAGAMLQSYSLAKTDSDEDKRQRADAEEAFMTAIHSFWRTKLAMNIVCGQKIGNQFEVIDHKIALINSRARQGRMADAWMIFEEIQKAKRELADVIREVLGFDAIPQSNGASAAPTPD